MLHLFGHRDVADFHKGPAALFPDFLCNRLQLASGPSYQDCDSALFGKCLCKTRAQPLARPVIAATLSSNLIR